MNDINDYHISGLAVISDKDPCRFIEPWLPNVSWYKHWDGSGQVFAPDLEQQLRRTYIEVYEALLPHFYEVNVLKLQLRNGMDDGSYVWHNDGNEGITATAIVFFSTLQESFGGVLGVRNNMTGVESSYCPKHGDIVIFSQKEHFSHKVTPMLLQQDRIGAFFDCVLRP